MPDLSPMLAVSDPRDSSEWLNVQAFGEWKSEGADESDVPTRRVSFSLGAFLVRKEDLSSFLKDAAKGEWTGHEVSGPDLEHRFLGEFAWAPSFREFRDDAAADLGEPLSDDAIERTSVVRDGTTAAHPVLDYVMNPTFDCSTLDGVHGFMPSVWLAGRMGLRWSGRRFRFSGKDGRVVAFDPSHEERGIRCLLYEREALNEFLHAHQMTLVWLIVGEKMLYGE